MEKNPLGLDECNKGIEMQLFRYVVLGVKTKCRKLTYYSVNAVKVEFL